MASRRVYRILFHDRNQNYEIYAKSVTQGSLNGFVEVEQVLFGEKSSIVVDPSEERLRHEFEGVKRLYIPFHSIMRIDEVEKQGTNRIVAHHKPEPPPK